MSLSLRPPSDQVQPDAKSVARRNGKVCATNIVLDASFGLRSRLEDVVTSLETLHSRVRSSKAIWPSGSWHASGEYPPRLNKSIYVEADQRHHVQLGLFCARVVIHLHVVTANERGPMLLHTDAQEPALLTGATTR